MDLDLNVLDRGLSRFLEHNLTLIFGERRELDEFRSAAQTLLLQWPVLGERVNLLRTELRHPRRHDHTSEILQGRTVDRRVDELVSLPSEVNAVQVLNPVKLERILGGSCFPETLRENVLTIQTVVLLDGYILRFKVQHPFGDANAMIRIAQTFCAILQGEQPAGVSCIRPPAKLKLELRKRTPEKSSHGNSHTIAAQHGKVFRASWFAFLNAARRQKVRDIVHRSSRRVSKTLFVPQSHVDKWTTEAHKRRAHVTEHDLVLSFLYQQAAKDSSRAHDFAIIMNIQRQLEFEAAFGNPWIVVPVLQGHSDQPTTRDVLTRLVDRAVHIRRAIVSAREPQCLSEIITQHCSMKNRPLVPRHFAARAPQLMVTSWARQPVFDLDFHGINPLLVEASVDLCGVMRSFDFHVDDLLVVWKENGCRNGYWVHGLLEHSVWMRMTEALR